MPSLAPCPRHASNATPARPALCAACARPTLCALTDPAPKEAARHRQPVRDAVLYHAHHGRRPRQHRLLHRRVVAPGRVSEQAAGKGRAGTNSARGVRMPRTVQPSSSHFSTAKDAFTTLGLIFASSVLAFAMVLSEFQLIRSTSVRLIRRVRLPPVLVPDLACPGFCPCARP